MGILGDAINTVYNTGQSVVQTGKGLIDDVSTFVSGLTGSVGAAVSSQFSGDVVGINAAKIPEMKQAIEDYIKKVESHLNEIKTNTSTENAMKGEYATAVKTYVGAACDVCFKITSQLRYFEDKLTAVEQAYQQKDENLAGTISDTASDMNSQYTEYKPQS